VNAIPSISPLRNHFEPEFLSCFSRIACSRYGAVAGWSRDPPRRGIAPEAMSEHFAHSISVTVPLDGSKRTELGRAARMLAELLDV